MKPTDPVSIYVAIDETGNLGKSLSGERYYVVAGCVVTDKEQFENVAKKYATRKGVEEVKFYSDPELRIPILKETAPYVTDVYYVAYHKDKSTHNEAGQPNVDKVAIHKGMLTAIADRIILDQDAEYYEVEIDENDLVRNSVAEGIFEKNEYLDEIGAGCDAKVRKSKDFFGLQANDIYVGSIGYSFNGPDGSEKGKPPRDAYVKRMARKPKRVYLRNLKALVHRRD